MKTVIFLTSQTSGTGSIQRMLKTLSKGNADYQQYFDDVVKPTSPQERISLVPPREGHVLTHNYPPAFNDTINFGDYRFLVNFRDPRDRLCNMYAWQFSHYSAQEEEERRAREEKVREMGSDGWVLAQIDGPNALRYYDKIFTTIENAPECHVATYAQLCCNFDAFVSNVLRATGFELSDAQKEFLESERPEKLTENTKWIGSKWAGSDVLPGRYKNELKYSTVVELNKYFSEALKRMAKHDPEFAELYLEGL